MIHFRTTILGLGCVLIAAIILLLACLSWTRSASCRRMARESEAVLALRDLEKVERTFARFSGERVEIRRFMDAWDAHLRPSESDQHSALSMRTQLEMLAQRRLGLVTDQALVPDPVKISLGRRPLYIQRVALRASGESLASLLTWLGEAEAAFPCAHVEEWELAPGAGSGSALRITLSQPLLHRETGVRKGTLP